jgi:hypothetical protein
VGNYAYRLLKGKYIIEIFLESSKTIPAGVYFYLFLSLFFLRVYYITIAQKV